MTQHLLPDVGIQEYLTIISYDAERIHAYLHHLPIRHASSAPVEMAPVEAVSSQAVQSRRNSHPLKRARTALCLTQDMLADFAGVSPSTIYRAETGKAVRVDSLKLICDFFGKTPQELGLLPTFASSERGEK